MNIINTNARSLSPKIDSFIECYEELNVDIAVITETWLKDGPHLDQDLLDLERGAGIGSLTLNRDPNPSTRVAHGGVAIFFQSSVFSFKTFRFDNPHKFEILPAVLSIKGSARKLVVVAAYVPPNYTVPRARQCLEHIESLVIEVRRKFRDPYIVVAGDFNQWGIDQALIEFPDLREVHVGPTRGERAIDRLFCNFTRGITASGTVPPLETEAEQGQEAEVTTLSHTCQLRSRLGKLMSG